MIAQGFSDLQTAHDGARYYKVDLHVHTPASHDYQAKGVGSDDIVRAALEADLDMIAITDHHTGRGFEDVREAAGTDLVVLPGVEVVAEGVHILGLFPEEKACADIVYLLHNLEIKDEDMGRKETISSVELTIPDVLRHIERAGGFPIAAHTDSTKGLTEEIRGRWRSDLMAHKALKVLEVTRLDSTRFFDGSDPTYKRRLTCVRSSDAHHPGEVGRRATWVRMGQCSYRSLKQIIFEPELRVSLEEPVEEPHPKILGMVVSGGLYQRELLRLNANLNVVIGGRGAGKSAIVDFLRYALGFPPRSPEYTTTFNGRIVDLLGLGQSVVVYVETHEGAFAVERRLVNFKSERVSPSEERVVELISEEQTYQLISGRAVEIDAAARDILEVEVFGQGEVFELTKRADDQLSLIDEYVGAADLLEQEGCLVRRLEGNSEQIVSLDKSVEELSEQLEEVDDVERQIAELSTELSAELFTQRALWDAEKGLLEEAVRVLREEDESARAALRATQAPELPVLEEGSPNRQALAEVQALVAGVFEELTGLRKKAVERVRKARERVDAARSEWQVGRSAYDEEFDDHLAELGATDQKALSDRLGKLRGRKFELEQRVKPQHQEQSQALTALRSERAGLLGKLQAKREELSAGRKQTVAEMSEELEKGDVRIEIRPGANRERFFRLLNDTYTGSDIKHREKNLRGVCASCTPEELADLLARGAPEQLQERFSLTSDVAAKLVAKTTLEHIHQIQICPLGDELTIYLRKAPGEDFSPLKDLSYGEKCTAIFSIALLGREKPLLVDQPEDELDHAFIIDNIVAHIRDVKERRQLLICTHNANIPVLGDAELILKVAKVPGEQRCEVEARGAFETPVIIDCLQELEGGPEAFRRRREKYGLD